MKILVLISGGVCQEVLSDDYLDAELIIVDHDNPSVDTSPLDHNAAWVNMTLEEGEKAVANRKEKLG